MKALGRGPITRLANLSRSSGGAVAGAMYSREDWSAGRDLSAEEGRCGMVARIADATNSPSSSHAGSSLRLEALVRAQSTDAQLSEVDANGQGAFLEKAPRGRWQKISRAKSLLVEDTSKPFSNPDKSFSPRVQSYGEYVRRVGRLPDGHPVLRFVLYRDGYSLASVRHRFHYEIGVADDALCLHQPPGGSFGTIAQFGVAVGVTREQLAHVSRHYNVHPLLLDDRSYHSLSELGQLAAPPQGHLYRVVLRCVPGDEAAVSARLRQLNTGGFINYFGVESFGVGGNTLFDLAAFAHRGDVHHSVGGYLQMLAESSPLHHQAYLSYANAESGTTTGAVEEWKRLCERAKAPRGIRDVLSALYRHHSLADMQPETIAGTASSMAIVWATCNLAERSDGSASAFVWNAMASQRLLSCGTHPVPGDLVRHRASDGSISIVELRTAEEAASYGMEDVMLPVPTRDVGLRYPSHGVNRDLFAQFARQHHLSFLFPEEVSESTLPQGDVSAYRPVVSRPQRLEAAVLNDAASCATLKSDHFLMQQRQPTESWSLDYERRVREPSPFTVSERFREKMHFVRQYHTGENTVVLSFILPTGSSPWVALREVFDLRYGTFHDLYGLE